MSEPENILQTVLNQLPIGEVSNLLHNTADENPSAYVVAIPKHMDVRDLTDVRNKLATQLQPWRRTGTAKLTSLQSLIDWANRNKGDTSAMFASDSDAPSLTCIADYPGAGAAVMDATSRDPAASYARHRAVYNFPVSDEWKVWNAVSGKSLGKGDLGEFTETNAKDMLDPSDMLVTGQMMHMEPWEKAMWQIAQQVQGRFGTPQTLIQLSRRFEVNERSNLSTSRNPDTGEMSFQFIDEHSNPDGTPVKIPNLFLIAIPVFENGPLYRLAVRFQYRKTGADVKFILTLHAPKVAFKDAVDLALDDAVGQTDLPLFRGTPETATP